MEGMSILVLVLLAALAGVAYWGVSQTREKKILQRRLDSYVDTFIKASGWNEIDGNYRIVSIDGGKTFYALGEEGKIIGPAEEVCPHAIAMDRLRERVEEGGPLDLTNPEDVKVLEAAGFEVVQKE